SLYRPESTVQRTADARNPSKAAGTPPPAENPATQLLHRAPASFPRAQGPAEDRRVQALARPHAGAARR
ncbi:unnamed protein product, partial [Urochloa humidicola]